MTPGLYNDVEVDRHPDPRREWASAFYLYTTDTGEWVLIKPNGEIGWLLLAARRIVPMAPSFSEFLERCTLCYRAYGVLNYYEVWNQLSGPAEDWRIRSDSRPISRRERGDLYRILEERFPRENEEA